MKTVHVISHSHWDREWYMPFEKHRARLVRLIDDCISLIENDKDFVCFNLDGHTAPIEDYLEIRPHMREKLKKYISEGKITVGPWYVLQDDYFTSSEANVRNLMEGMRLAQEFGKINMVGYFPDTFANAGQMPQLMKQAGMMAIYFGRGVKSVGANNQVINSESRTTPFSEMYWESPDKSRLPAILFANWYNNGVEIPKDGDKAYWDRKLNDTEFFAATDELLLMNGCDHQPVQKDISEALASARKNYPDYRFVQTDFEGYANAVIPKFPDNLPVVTGELTGQDTSGWGNLVGTASMHIDLKMLNRKCEIMLESVCEPLAVMASELGYEYPHDMLRYAWKTLMKNHAHDSICGCSVDEVNAEMKTRFDKSLHAAEAIAERCLDNIAEHIDISAFSDCSAVFAVFNTYSKHKSDVMSVVVDIERNYDLNLAGSAKEINSRTDNKKYVLTDEMGNTVPCSITRNPARFGYDLPDDKFRQPYMAYNVTVTFEADNIPPMGYKLYGIKLCENEIKKASMVTEKNTMENDKVKIKINENGTFDMTCKATGAVFKGIGGYEDTGDIGNEYDYHQSTDLTAFYSKDTAAKIELAADEEYMAQYKITTVMRIPRGVDDTHMREVLSCVPCYDRTAKRSSELTDLVIETVLTLERHGAGVKVKTVINNTAENHRLRVLIPTGMKCETHIAESVFEAVKRPNKRGKNRVNPSDCGRHQGFVMMKEDKTGLMAVNRGIYEYEILEDNTVALTLLRAVSDMGDWGAFPTRLSQCLKKIEPEYEIIPYTDDDEAFSEAAAFQYPLSHKQIIKCGDGKFACRNLCWSGKYLRMTALKRSAENGVVMRWVNYSDSEQELVIEKGAAEEKLYKSDILERAYDVIPEENGQWRIKAEPFKVITLVKK